MDIQLGTPVKSQDGQTIGTVERLILAPKTNTFVEFIVHRGHILTTDRLVERGSIAAIDADGVVHLNVTTERADELPGFVQEHYVVPHQSTGGSWLGASRVRLLPATTAPQEVRSNVSGDDVLIDGGTDVISRDGHKVGSVAGVGYDSDGTVIAVVVKTGHLSHETVRIPDADVDSISNAQVLLSVRGDQLGTPQR